jgi:uncharacterized protein with GYD domain
MAMFVLLTKLTDQGAKNIQSLRTTVEANMARSERLGIKVHGWYLTQGQYDTVVILEAPDAEAVLASAAGVAGKGDFRTETLRAFTLDEADQEIKRVSGA